MRESLKRLLPKALGNYVNFLACIAPKTAARKAFAIFSKPRRGWVGNHHKPFLDPARKERLSLKNIELQTYHWPGTGKRILLTHGWESHTHRYKNLVATLSAAGYDIYAFDAPAQGYSNGNRLYVPIYEEALQRVKEAYKPHFIIAHSLGAMTAIYNQYKNPADYVEKMVILGAADKLEDILSDYQKIIGMSNRAMTALDKYFIKRFGFKKEEFSSSAFAKAIDLPALIVHDKGDLITRPSGSKNIYENWKNARLLLTEGLDHSLYGDEVNDAIIDFLKEEEPTPKNPRS